MDGPLLQMLVVNLIGCSSIKPGPDGDEAEMKTMLEVSYVDFDKTKPHCQKLTDERPQTPPQKAHNILTKDQLQKTPNNLSITNGKFRSATRKVDSISSIIKKRQNKSVDPDAKKSETTPKTSKKNKRDLS